MIQTNQASEDHAAVTAQADALFNHRVLRLNQSTDHIFVNLLAFQWLAAVATAFIVSPQAWAGLSSQVHPHIWAATVLGGAIVSLPIGLAWLRAGRASTRHVIAIAQMSIGVILIHLTGGRIETHFHVFGSLAFLASYRDWRVLVTGSIVVVVDHLFRGFFWPQSVYGVALIQPWLWLEHGGWVAFEDVFLIWSCRRGVGEMRQIAVREAELQRFCRLKEVSIDRRNAQIREVEAHKATMFETALDAILTMDHLGRVIDINPVAEATFGYSQEEAIGQDLAELIIPEGRRPAQRRAVRLQRWPSGPLYRLPKRDLRSSLQRNRICRRVNN